MQTRMFASSDLLSSPPHFVRVRTRVQEVESEQTQERFFRPHFLQAPGDMMAHEGKLCRLDCKVGSRACQDKRVSR